MFHKLLLVENSTPIMHKRKRMLSNRTTAFIDLVEEKGNGSKSPIKRKFGKQGEFFGSCYNNDNNRIRSPMNREASYFGKNTYELEHIHPILKYKEENSKRGFEKSTANKQNSYNNKLFSQLLSDLKSKEKQKSLCEKKEDKTLSLISGNNHINNKKPELAQFSSLAKAKTGQEGQLETLRRNYDQQLPQFTKETCNINKPTYTNKKDISLLRQYKQEIIFVGAVGVASPHNNLIIFDKKNQEYQQNHHKIEKNHQEEDEVLVSSFQSDSIEVLTMDPFLKF